MLWVFSFSLNENANLWFTQQIIQNFYVHLHQQKNSFVTKPYNDFSTWIRRKFPFKVQKISIDAGFSCPNRDGNLSTGGCTFCDNRSFNPSYCDRKKSIATQLIVDNRLWLKTERKPSLPGRFMVSFINNNTLSNEKP